MALLERNLRTVLEKTVVAARDKAEQAAKIALKTLAVDSSQPFTSHSSEQRGLRNELRSRARQLGVENQSAGFALLVEEVAYQQWHAMLFARFLAENKLLIRPSSRVAVTLEECDELAQPEGASNKWQLATRYAGHMLPGILEPGNPSVRVPFAPEGNRALENILTGLPSAVFTSDDGLGWVYQFWQSKKKKEVSSSERKIEKLDLAAYSQLFTEDYMVRFLLENTLGAWWASRHADSVLVKDFRYLRLRDDGTPAAGIFPNWPERAADITVMDPCCGSGHFLVAAFEMLRHMREEEESLGEAEAAEAVLRDNLFGLEIDPRCVQIAAFTLALAAWKVGGYRELPLPNVACSGIPVGGQLQAWTKLASQDANMRHALERLHRMFVNAPDLGSLINPANVPISERMFTPEYERVAPLLEYALVREKAGDPVAALFGSTALGATRAAEMLARQYTLVTTNVPYLARGKQGDQLKDLIGQQYPEGKADLATAFIERCRSFCLPSGTYALVSPQNWLFLTSYEKLRLTMLREQKWQLLARLGSSAFETISGAVVNVALLIVTNESPSQDSTWEGIDVSEHKVAQDKAVALVTSRLLSTTQAGQLGNPNARIVIGGLALKGAPLSEVADTYEGLHTGDYPRFGRYFWELPAITAGWALQQSAPMTNVPWGGRQNVIFWENGRGELLKFVKERLQSEATTLWIKGHGAWDKRGVAVAVMQDLRATLYDGKVFTHGVFVVIPKDEVLLPGLWVFLQSNAFRDAARSLDQKLAIARSVFDGVPFDATYWKAEAARRYPEGLSAPESEDPTQWVFKGDPRHSEEPLQVAVSRLLGYSWPVQSVDNLSPLAIPDGILSLSSSVGREPASEQLRNLLASAYGQSWSAELQSKLLTRVAFADKGLGAWLRDGFFKQHCKLFRQRPFIWHVWDGLKDGFSALAARPRNTVGEWSGV